MLRRSGDHISGAQNPGSLKTSYQHAASKGRQRPYVCWRMHTHPLLCLGPLLGSDPRLCALPHARRGELEVCVLAHHTHSLGPALKLLHMHVCASLSALQMHV